MTDVLTGIAFILLIAALAGGIAYVGDRVGHQVGRKRLTLFGIRPRYTSTIVAIGTGVVIALIVTVGAILASNEVKLAFFQMRTINAQLNALHRQLAVADKKVNETQIVIPIYQPVTANVAKLPKGSSEALREKIVRDYYASTVQIVNASYPQLKSFQPPQDVTAQLKLLADKADVAANDVLVIAAADKNLFVGDRIHFGLQAYADKLVAKSGEVIASLTIPAGPTTNVGLAFGQLQQHVADALVKKGLSPLFIGTPQAERTYPSAEEMQKMLVTGQGTYVMTAFAAEDIYPHTALQSGGVPIVVALSEQP